MILVFPYPEAPQPMNPLAQADIITRQGGGIILYANCTSPLPDFPPELNMSRDQLMLAFADNVLLRMHCYALNWFAKSVRSDQYISP